MFFKSLSEITPNLDLTLRLMQKGDKVTVAVLPTTLEEVRPLTITGTIDELDAGFMDAIRKPLQVAAGLVTNADDFEKDASSKKTVAAITKEKVKEQKKATPAKEEKPAPLGESPTPADQTMDTAQAETAPETNAPPAVPYRSGDRVIYINPGPDRAREATVASDELTADGKVKLQYDGDDTVQETEPTNLALNKRKVISEAPIVVPAPAPPRPTPPAPPRPSASAATDQLFPG